MLLENSELTEFSNLIDALHRCKEQESIERQFEKIAKYLMNELCLIAGNKKYRIVECEFYYDDHYKHSDPYIYKETTKKKEKKNREEHNKKLGWLLHDSGIDLTIGNDDVDKPIYGGILIRGIENIGTETFISGPLNTSKELFGNFLRSVTNSSNNFSNIHFIKIGCKNEYKPKKFLRFGLQIDKYKIEKNEQTETPFYKWQYRYADTKSKYIECKEFKNDEDVDAHLEKRLDKLNKKQNSITPSL
jgi:hypothetical protein